MRQKRKENAVKQLGYFTFYRLLRAISDIDIPLDSGDFCLMDRRVVEALQESAREGTIRPGPAHVRRLSPGGPGLRAGRERAGQPKYSLSALIGLAIDGLVSFSSYPLRLGTTYLGVATAILSGLLDDVGPD